MSVFDLKTISKYPFLGEAKDYVSSLNLTLEGIQNHPVYSPAVELGRQRVLDALNGRVNVDLSDRVSQELAVLSYVIARILVNLISDRRMVFRYAAAESRNAHNLLKREGRDILHKVEEDVGFRLDGDKMDFTLYLRLSKNLTSDSKWRLVNRTVDSGRVDVGEYEAIELLREAIRLRIMEPVDVRNVPEDFRKTAEQLRNATMGAPMEIKAGELDRDAIPPCISRMLSSLEAGNITHNGMFIVGTFFIGLGLRVDDVVRIFSASPRFNEEKSRYQIEFLAGEKSTTKYSCPTCVKIKSYGLCVSECNVKHPLHYYRDHIKGMKFK
jgi:DNA primase large subunit